MHMKTRYRYWELANYGFRLTGLVFILVGAFVSLSRLFNFDNPILVNGVPNDSIAYKLMIISAGIIFVTFGVVIIRLTPYFPQSIKEWKINQDASLNDANNVR